MKSRTSIAFHFKEALYGFSLAYPNSQHHFSGTLRLLLSKIRVAWTQALLGWDSGSDNRDRYGRETLGERMIRGPGGMEMHGERSHHAAQKSAQFKTHELFICGIFISGIFHVVCSDHDWSQVTKASESETTGKGPLFSGESGLVQGMSVQWVFSTCLEDKRSAVPVLPIPRKEISPLTVFSFAWWWKSRAARTEALS